MIQQNAVATVESAPALDSALAAEVEAIGRIGSVSSILQILLESTGLGFAAVARVTESVVDRLRRARQDRLRPTHRRTA